jgi:hypothetical protein
MSLDDIQQAIAALQSSDRYHLRCWLDEEFGDHEAEASVEAAWDTEWPVDSRMSLKVKSNSFLG